MELKKAEKIAESVVDLLTPYCEHRPDGTSYIEVAGSIRRQKPQVRDIDLVCVVKQVQVPYLGFTNYENTPGFLAALESLGKVKMHGPKIIRAGMGFSRGIDLDLYIATPETWATLLLIRTGSKEHNIKLCSRAKSMGLKLHANGSGLERCLAGQGTEVDNSTTSIIQCDSEESIFKELGLPYLEPEQRD